MSSFFVDKKVYKQRLEICRDCDSYFKPTGTCKVCGCFMRIKASIGVMECPELYWRKTTEVKRLEEIPKHLIDEAHNVWEGIKTGKAINIETKKRAITLYNTIHGTGYRTTTNCSSCLRAVRDGIQKIVNET
ncbi:MAG: hypothetical protein Unbinned4585contig1001_9 [Prokaryotic dsDNA virus sp.]|nr:MAG: hypothetical protein Unbinned4585contig1001_9 [Prokaryotic dsDNA virus sp.]|tara:strand:+ start:2669 stop:3064 length:396 start_codon:yes stop_codon:yes gene_type:complete